MMTYITVSYLMDNLINSIKVFPVVDNSQEDIQKAEDYFKQKVREITMISDEDLESLLDDGIYEQNTYNENDGKTLHESVQIVWDDTTIFQG